MSDSWPPAANLAPGPKRHGLKNVGGCMGVLSQMFQWSRVPGGSSKYIATPDEKTLSTSQIKQTEPQRCTQQLRPVVLRRRQHPRDGLREAISSESATAQFGSLSGCKVSDSMPREVDTDLRHILHAKQEPFVLQDVIREKRQPRRSQSSRELKFGNDGSPSRTKRLPRTRNTIAKDQVQAEDVDSWRHTSAASGSHCIAPHSFHGTAAVVTSSRVPAESMVAMPLHHAPAVRGTQPLKKARSKGPSPGRNPVKSPNKRALLMEAAAKILEGSNRRAPKPRSSSVRSLLEELEKSEHERGAFLHGEWSEREEILPQNVTICGEKLPEINQQNSVYMSKQAKGSSCKHHLECFQQDLLLMRRVVPYENALGDDEVLSTISTPVHCHSLVNDIEYGPWPAMEETQKKSMNQMGMDDNNGLTKESGAIVPSTSTHLFPSKTCLPNSNNPMLPLVETFLDPSVWRFHASLLLNLLQVDNIACGRSGNTGSSSKLRGGVRLIEVAADVVVQARLVDLHTAGNVTKGSKISDTFVEADIVFAAERQNGIPRLCNYSWWASCEQNSPTQSVENGTNQASQCSPRVVHISDECVGYDSSAVTTPFCIKVFEGRREADDCEEEASISSGYSCVEEFQQSSPVSVLEPVYKEEPGDSFDYFDEARQKLLENVRRYEMLAHMDLDTLMMVSEEHFSHAWDDDNLNESWETDSRHGQQVSSLFRGSFDKHISSRVPHMEAQEFMEHDDDTYVLLPEDGLSFRSKGDRHIIQEVPTSDCSFEVREKFKPRRSCKVLLDCLSEASELDALRDPWTEEEVGKRACSSGRVVIDALVHMDLTSNWSNSYQEVQELELELESSLFRILMCELLSDLLQQN